MLTRKALNTVLKGVREELAKLGFSPERIILFGSYANGKVHKYSDVDLAVWDERFSGIGLKDFEKIKVIKRRFPMVNIKTYKAASTAENDDPFIEVIEKTGIEILHEQEKQSR